MTKRQPLNLLQKWLVAQYWVCQQPPLTRASIAVLMRLLDRQNPKTGRCDPSAVGLLEEIGYSERSVRGAFRELEERGALERFRVARRSRNQFQIFSVEDLEQSQRLPELKSRSGKRTGLKPFAAPPEMHCRPNPQRPAPETIKETKKKTERAEREIAAVKAVSAEERGKPCAVMGLGEFERRVVKVFEREGYGYEELMAVPAQDVEQAYGQMADGCITFSDAVKRLLKTYKSWCEPS